MLKGLFWFAILSLAPCLLAQQTKSGRPHAPSRAARDVPATGQAIRISEFRGPFQIPSRSTGYEPLNWKTTSDGCDFEVGMLRHDSREVGFSVDATRLGHALPEPLVIRALDRDLNRVALRTSVSQQRYRIDGNRWGFQASERAEIALPASHNIVVEIRWLGHLVRTPELRP